jgi:predicted DNA-binding transcriptional regulator AlpA
MIEKDTFVGQSVGKGMSEPVPVMLTASELAVMLHISTRSLWRMLSAGQLPNPVRLGGAVRWPVEEIKKWIAAGCPTGN